jgi:DNA repair exonuclease SbcCD nuclease subunit
MKILRVGDPHVKVTNIDESDRLMDFVGDVAREHKVDRIEILGDLFHTHSVLRLEVLEFWNAWLDTLSESQELVVLVGNHDQSGDYNSHSNALSIFNRLKKTNLHIVEYPKTLGVFGYVPYIHEPAKFIEQCNSLVSDHGARVIVSHNTYQGSKYENGFYAPDGVNPESINCGILISGHIHSRQSFRTGIGQIVIYPGTARWDTASDANQPKGIWLYEHDDATGEILKEQYIDTSKVCSPIVSVTVNEGGELPAIVEGVRLSVELVGSSDWVTKQKNILKGKASIKTKITDKAKFEHRKSGNSLMEFIDKHYVTSIDKARLLNYMKELQIV